MLTQAAVEVHVFTIIEALHRAIRQLHKQSGRRIVVVLVGSTGGGCGSALVPILGKLLADPAFRSLVTEGFGSEILARPIALVAEPFAFAFDNRKAQRDKILANSMAFRIETDLLERQGVFQYLFHAALSNGHGAVLDTKDSLGKALGSNLYALCRDYPYLKSRWVDTVDSNRDARYGGRDIPEYHYPVTDHPPYAAQPRDERRTFYISICNDRLQEWFKKGGSRGQNN